MTDKLNSIAKIIFDNFKVWSILCKILSLDLLFIGSSCKSSYTGVASSTFSNWAHQVSDEEDTTLTCNCPVVNLVIPVASSTVFNCVHQVSGEEDTTLILTFKLQSTGKDGVEIGSSLLTSILFPGRGT